MKFTRRQGEYLAFLHHYRLLNKRPAAERDVARFFEVSAPSAHQMVVTLEHNGLIRRTPGVGRSIKVLVDPRLLPPLQGQPSPAEAPPTPENGSGEKVAVAVGRRIVEKLYEQNELYAMDDREFVPLLRRVLEGVEEGLGQLGLGPLSCEWAREQVRAHAEGLYVRLCAEHDPEGADEAEDVETFRHLMLYGEFPSERT